MPLQEPQLLIVDVAHALVRAASPLMATIGFLCAAAVVHAQPGPQFTWEGQVDGIVVLHVRRERVDIEYRQGKPAERQSFHFIGSLPDLRQDVRVEVREGRGAVRVSQQPRIENNFTADITIEDRQDGASFYSIGLYWAESGTPSGRMDHVNWSGRVDGEVTVECHAGQCDPSVESGQPVGRARAKFTRPLPNHDVRVWLDETGGRADIKILEQPSALNHYTVKVLVRAFGGGGDCSFILSWPRERTAKMQRTAKQRLRIRQ
jgi:hypothetical protein